MGSEACNQTTRLREPNDVHHTVMIQADDQAVLARWASVDDLTGDDVALSTAVAGSVPITGASEALAEPSDVPWPSLTWQRLEAERRMQWSAQQRESLSSLLVE